MSSPSPLSDAATSARPRRGLGAILVVGLVAVLVVAVIASAGIGQLSVPPLEVLQSVFSKAGIDLGIDMTNPQSDATLWAIRFPRIALGVLVGAALAASGVLMQSVFGNPLADAGVIGVSSGAALGAAASITFGLGVIGEWTAPAAAFVTGLATVFIVYFASRSGGRTEVVTLLLTGIAVTAFTGAGLALLTFLGDTSSREQIVFWQLGSLNGTRWPEVAIVAALVLVGLVVAFSSTRVLDLFSLGDQGARHLGVDVERWRMAVIVVVALLVCAAVAFAGIISFVGLVVPHLMRMLIGPAHRPLLVTSTLGGAVLIVVADLVARTAVPLADLPIGMLTSLIGGPFFFWLLMRMRRRSGGWA